jgi:polyisoprenoid-binding protein YceI
MSTTTDPSSAAVSDLAPGVWRLDPRRSSVEFHVRHFYGLMIVKGHLMTTRAPSRLPSTRQ